MISTPRDGLTGWVVYTEESEKTHNYDGYKEVNRNRHS